MGNSGSNNGDDWGQTEPQGPSLIVKAAVRERLGETDVSSDFYAALDEEVRERLHEAAERARENDRKTVQPRDL